jgi:Ni/Co efflux regulator RcnB
MKRLILGIAATLTALGPIAAAGTAAASPGGIAEAKWKDNRDDRGDRRDESWDRRDDRKDDRWDRRDDRKDYRWDRRDDRRDDRWDRRDDRWDNRWDRRSDWRDDRRDSHRYYSWDHGRHNGYYYRNSWYYGPPPSAYYGDPYYRPAYHAWKRGYRVPNYYNSYVVYDYHHHHLRRPPRGYHWVRADNDFLLVAIASGIIADVILNGGY